MTEILTWVIISLKNILKSLNSSMSLFHFQVNLINYFKRFFETEKTSTARRFEKQLLMDLHNIFILYVTINIYFPKVSIELFRGEAK